MGGNCAVRAWESGRWVVKSCVYVCFSVVEFVLFVCLFTFVDGENERRRRLRKKRKRE